MTATGDVHFEHALDLPDSQKVLGVVVDVLLLSRDMACQFDGEHDDFDGLLPFDEGG